MGNKGVYTTTKKDGTVYYRTSFTYRGKHIALGSFDTMEKASRVYVDAQKIVSSGCAVEDYKSKYSIPFEKFVVLINYRDNKMYIPNPIYVHKNYFSYYLGVDEELKFSIDDLFYYTNHKICKRGGHMYVNDFGMQLNMPLRYGIKNYAVKGKDYDFSNGDELDYRYENIIVNNYYQGVEYSTLRGKACYKTKIHINGDCIVGYFDDCITAAVAYNKAVDELKKVGIDKAYATNFVEEISAKTYAGIYSQIELRDSFYKCIGQ